MRLLLSLVPVFFASALHAASLDIALTRAEHLGFFKWHGNEHYSIGLTAEPLAGIFSFDAKTVLVHTKDEIIPVAIIEGVHRTTLDVRRVGGQLIVFRNGSQYNYTLTVRRLSPKATAADRAYTLADIEEHQTSGALSTNPSVPTIIQHPTPDITSLTITYRP